MKTIIIFTLFSVFLFVNLTKGQDFSKLGNEELDKGNYENAIEYYSLYVQKYPGWDAWGVYYNRGLAYSSLQKYDDAIADYTKAIELMPDYADSYFCRGTIYFSMQKFKEAIADYTTAIQLKTIYYKWAYYFRGLTYYHLQKHDEAIADLMMALQFKLEIENNMVYLSLLYFEKQSYEDSRLWMNKAIAIEPRLNEGMTGIEKLEKDGWHFTQDEKENLKNIFKLLGK